MSEKHGQINGLGERLYTLREDHALSQDELAEKLNVSRQTISNWENDKVKLDVVKAAELCRLYEIGMDELLLGKEKSSGDETQSRIKKTKAKRVLLWIAFVLSISLIVISIIFLTTANTDTVSSEIYLSATAGWVIAIVCGIVVCVI